MPKVTFITRDGEENTISDGCGTLMDIGREHEIDGIDGDCGGVCSCSTCHVYVARQWMERVGPPGDLEQDTLEFNEHRRECSRLGCQVELTDELDGLVVTVAPADE